MSQDDLQKALYTFLSLNPNIHQLPPTTLVHLTVLHVQVCRIIIIMKENLAIKDVCVHVDVLCGCACTCVYVCVHAEEVGRDHVYTLRNLPKNFADSGYFVRGVVH